MSVSVTTRRFVAFADAEIGALWDALTMDDGLRYGFDRDQVEYPMAVEVLAEADQRGIALPDRWAADPPV